MALTKPEPIYLLVTDLAALRKLPTIPKEKINLSLYHFALLKHWAIQVRGYCYEVNSRPRITEPTKTEYYLHNSCSLPEWEETVARKKLSWERVEVGATTDSDLDIHNKSETIWADRFTKKYRLDRQNCQNFAYLLYKQIAIEPEKIKEDMRGSWKTMPRRFTDVAHFFKSSISSSMARTLVIELLADAAALGAELVGLEGAIALEVLGLEVAGVALLGPIGEVIFAITIIALIVKKSRDKKWLSRINKKITKKDKKALKSGRTNSELEEEELKSEAARVLTELTEEAKAYAAAGVKPPTVTEIEDVKVEEKEMTDTKAIMSSPTEVTEVRVVDIPSPTEAPPPPPYALIDTAADEYRPPLPPRRSKATEPGIIDFDKLIADIEATTITAK